MSKELIERLRSVQGGHDDIIRISADAIESLTAERDRLAAELAELRAQVADGLAGGYCCQCVHELCDSCAPLHPHVPAQVPNGALLWRDMKTDSEKANYILSGRAYATGILAHAIQNDVAMAYQRCANYAAHVTDLEAELAELRGQEPVAWRYQDGNGNYRYRGYVAGFDVDYRSLKPVPLYAAPPAAKDSLTTDSARIPFSLPDAAVERIYDNARRLFRVHKSMVCGQQITQADSYEYHIINATLDELRDTIDKYAPVPAAVPDADPFGDDAELCASLQSLDTDIGYRAASRIGQLAMLAAAQKKEGE